MEEVAYKQEPPYCVQVELTEGCNLRCAFCGLNGIRGPDQHEYKFMSVETAVHVANSIAKSPGWNPRIEFALRGEPTLNKARAGIVAAFRQALPRASLMMTSNGGGLLAAPGPVENIRALFKAGLNTLALDDYDHAKLVPRIREALHEGDYARGVEWDEVEYPADGGDASPHKRRSTKTPVLVFVADISKTSTGSHSTTMMNNHCGAGSEPRLDAPQKPCAKPFRELIVHHDGRVPICCNDWRGHFKVSNLLNVDTAEEVWQHPYLQAARRFLVVGERSFGPCRGCDARSWRTGLLPDKKGKVKLPVPGARDRELVERACAGQPYTRPVLRPWEREGRTSLPLPVLAAVLAAEAHHEDH